MLLIGRPFDLLCGQVGLCRNRAEGLFAVRDQSVNGYRWARPPSFLPEEGLLGIQLF